MSLFLASENYDQFAVRFWEPLTYKLCGFLWQYWWNVSILEDQPDIVCCTVVITNRSGIKSEFSSIAGLIFWIPPRIYLILALN